MSQGPPGSGQPSQPDQWILRTPPQKSVPTTSQPGAGPPTQFNPIPAVQGHDSYAYMPPPSQHEQSYHPAVQLNTPHGQRASISQEGPIRRIASPPFAGAFAQRGAGPLVHTAHPAPAQEAHTWQPQAAPRPPYPGGSPQDPLSHLLSDGSRQSTSPGGGRGGQRQGANFWSEGSRAPPLYPGVGGAPPSRPKTPPHNQQRAKSPRALYPGAPGVPRANSQPQRSGYGHPPGASPHHRGDSLPLGPLPGGGGQPYLQQMPPLPPPSLAGASLSARVLSLEERVDEFLKGSSAVQPTPDQANASSTSSLKALGRMRAWKRVVEVAGTLLANGGLAVEDQTDVLLCRALALVRLKRYAEVTADLEQLARTARATNTPPPFTAHLLAVEVKMGTDRTDDAIDALNALRRALERHIDLSPEGRRLGYGGGGGTRGGSLEDLAEDLPSASLDTAVELGLEMSLQEALLWRRRVLVSMANGFAQQYKWRPALGMLQMVDQEVCALAPPAGGAEGGDTGGVALSEQALRCCRLQTLSRIGRIFLQMGDLHHVTDFFNRARDAWGASEEDLPPHGEDLLGMPPSPKGDYPSGPPREQHPQILMNRGLLAFAKNDFVGAGQEFEAVMALERRQARGGSPLDHTAREDCTGIEGDGTLISSAANNLSVAALYSCDLERALSVLEGMVKEDPAAHLWGTVAFNLCTLYDLSYDNATSQRQKQVLEEVANRFHLHDVDASCFRMT